MLKPLEEWHKRSQEALNTVTKMVVDIAQSLVACAADAKYTVDAMPPTYPYIARAALSHARRIVDKEMDWMSNAENILQSSHDMFSQRWGITHDG